MKTKERKFINVEEFKKMTEKQRLSYGKNFPMGETYYNDGKILSTKRKVDVTLTNRGENERVSKVFWTERTYDDNKNELSLIMGSGFWRKTTYNKFGDELTGETSRGFWRKITYDENRNEVFVEDSSGFWCKKSYDEKGNQTFQEDSYGYWEESAYDENNKEISFKTSDGDFWVKDEQVSKKEFESFMEEFTKNK